jgi:dihydroorotase
MRASKARSTRVFAIACGTIGRAGDTPAPIHALIQAGAVGISDDGAGIADSSVMAAVLKHVADCDSVFMQHCQEPTLTRGAAMNAGALATRLGVGGWPAEAEEIMLRRDIVLNKRIGARYHAQHMSTAASMAAIAQARADGQSVTGEASPHHLLLTEDACDGWNTAAKVNPPLRTQADVDALRAAVSEGVISVLATDHAPHPVQSKATDFQSASFGMSAIEICLPLYREALIDSGAIDWPRMIAMMTCEGAALVGLHKRGLGRLTTNGPADITIIDPDANWVVNPDAFRSKGRNTPFAGRPLQGRAVATLRSGRLIWNMLGDRAVAGIEPVA